MTEPQTPRVNKWLIIGGGVGLIGVWYFLKRQKASTPTAPQTDQYGNPVDANGNPIGINTTPYGTTPSAYGYFDPATNTFITPGSGASVITAPATVAAWSQQTAAQLANVGGDVPSFLSGVANWLYGPNRLSDAEYTAVEQGITLEGMPPGVTTVPARAQTTQSSPPPIQPPVLRYSAQRVGKTTYITLSWNAVPGAVKYNLYRLNIYNTTVGGTSYQYREINPNIPWTVRAVDANGKLSQSSNVIVVH